jgi:hypothetical protein
MAVAPIPKHYVKADVMSNFGERFCPRFYVAFTQDRIAAIGPLALALENAIAADAGKLPAFDRERLPGRLTIAGKLASF